MALLQGRRKYRFGKFKTIWPLDLLVEWIMIQNGPGSYHSRYATEYHRARERFGIDPGFKGALKAMRSARVLCISIETKVIGKKGVLQAS